MIGSRRLIGLLNSRHQWARSGHWTNLPQSAQECSTPFPGLLTSRTLKHRPASSHRWALWSSGDGWLGQHAPSPRTSALLYCRRAFTTDSRPAGGLVCRGRLMILVLPRQESFASLHILTRRASEGSEALPSLARRVRMSFFGA